MSLSPPDVPEPGTSAPAGFTGVLVDVPRPGARVLRISGALGPGSAARMLRVLDAQLMMVRSGHRRLDVVIVDISAVQALDRGGPEALQHGQYACARLGIEFVLAGHPAGLHSAPVRVRRRLDGVRVFPTVDAALDATGDRRSGSAAVESPGP